MGIMNNWQVLKLLKEFDLREFLKQNSIKQLKREEISKKSLTS